jgi:RNA polymerase sigma-70 factor (ECF subfamily)
MVLSDDCIYGSAATPGKTGKRVPLMTDWQAIVERHGSAVWQTAYRLLDDPTDAADCFQETFVSALAVLRRGPVQNWPALLKRLATTRALDRLRRRSRHTKRHHDIADWASIAGKNPGPVEQAENSELAANLREALAQLPLRQAEIFCLRHIEGLSYDEIGQQIGLDSNTVGVQLHRARRRLRELLSSVVDANER